MFNKRGSEKYYVIISMILGLLIVAIVIYFLFNEYFTQDDIDWETCRQSVILRATAPEADGLIKTVSGLEKFKDTFPLKCKTEVVDVEITGQFGYENLEAMKTIADSMMECWYLFGSGNYRIFPGNMILEKQTCVICKRIHFNSKNSNYLSSALPLGDYLFKTDINGNTLPESEWGGEKSYYRNLQYPVYGLYQHDFGEKFVLPGESEISVTTETYKPYGSKGTLIPAEGDLLIGIYWYHNKNLLGLLHDTERIMPFYAQQGVDTLICDIEGIPA